MSCAIVYAKPVPPTNDIVLPLTNPVILIDEIDVVVYKLPEEPDVPLVPELPDVPLVPDVPLTPDVPEPPKVALTTPVWGELK